MQRRAQGASDALGAHTGVLKMRGLPFAASKQDLVEWFRHLPIAPLQPDACALSPFPTLSRPQQHLAALSTGSCARVGCMLFIAAGSAKSARSPCSTISSRGTACTCSCTRQGTQGNSLGAGELHAPAIVLDRGRRGTPWERRWGVSTAQDPHRHGVRRAAHWHGFCRIRLAAGRTYCDGQAPLRELPVAAPCPHPCPCARTHACFTCGGVCG